MTTNEPWPKRSARILPLHGLSMPDYYLLCTAGYRVTLERERFIKHAAWAFEGEGWPDVTHEEMASALDHLLEAGLLQVVEGQLAKASGRADFQFDEDFRNIFP